jgi:predicted permease
VLSDGLWRERFGAAPGVLGRQLRLDGEAYEIVGVMPPGFYFPAREIRFWRPTTVPRRGKPQEMSISIAAAIGRLRPGVTPEQAAAEGTAAARAAGDRTVVADLIFGKGGPVEVKAARIADQLTASIRPAVLVLAAGVGVVLLIACANVANLFLSRGVSRERELAVRAALGAGRGRLLAQLVTESLALSALGGALGLAAAWAFTRVLPQIAPRNFPRLADVQVDGTALAFAVAASLVAGLLAGLVPALRASRVRLVPSLRDGVGASSGARIAALRAGLLVAEAALAVVLLVGAGLLMRSFARLVQVDAGYDPLNVLTARIYLPGADRGEAQTAAFVDRLLERLRATPGVMAAGGGSMAPLSDSTAISGFQLPDIGPDGQRIVARALSYVVTPGFAEALGLRLREGRLLSPSDVSAPTQALVVNEEFVRAYLTDGRPVLGRRYTGILRSADDDETVTEIVGVVGNVLKDGLDAKPQAEIYLVPRGDRRITRTIYLAVRTAGDPLLIVPSLRAYVRDQSATAALDEVTTLANQVSASVGQPRFAAALLAAFAALALTLAAVGLYGVLSYNITRRRREMGVRAALGATRGNLVGLVVRQGMAVTLGGLALGMAAAAAVTRLMQNLLFGVEPLDPVSFVVAPTLLAAVALGACLVPALRAAHVDPADALRHE